MTLTPQERTLIANELHRLSITKKTLSDAVGLKPSWVTKILNGTIKGISDEQERVIEKLIGKKLRKFDEKVGSVSLLASEIDVAMKENPALTRALAAILEALPAANAHHLPVVNQKQLEKIGANLTTIVHRWEEGNDPHYAKIGAEALTFLREFYKKAKL